MSLHFIAPAALWLLALLAVVWLRVWPGRRERSGGSRLLHRALRSLVLTCIVGALAQPVLSVPAARIAMIYLVDVSHSISTGALDSAAASIDALTDSLRPDAARILAFGDRAAAVADTAALRRLAHAPDGDELDRLVVRGETNLEDALAAARAEIPTGMNGRMLLFSDGRETAGDSRRIIERLAAERIPVFTQPAAVRDLGDTWVEAVDVPRAPVAQAITTIDVSIGAQRAGHVDVTIRDQSRVVAQRSVAAAVGASIVSLEMQFETPGPHLIEASVAAARDVIAENNRLLREVIVEPRPRVLYVHAAEGDPGIAALALARAGMQVTKARPEALPAAVAAFDRWDVVVLSNIARPRLSVGAMTALSSWVEDHGGGLLFVGGQAVVGEALEQGQPGYRGSAIERVLPVSFDREDEPDVALVIVLDRSWSMNGPAMELSKAAAEAAANTLDPTQLVGVLTFNNQSNWDVPLGLVRDRRATLHDAIAGITASGPTDIYPALEHAYDALAAVRARAKHVILLSDGQTAPADYESLLARMTKARITVSSVALGKEADAALLGNVAKWGGGRSYVVQDAQQIPEIFVKEAKSATSPGGEDQGATVRFSRAAAWLRNAAAPMPLVRGRTEVTRKPDALELLSTARGDALLSLWPAGLGRTAMLAADVDGRWSGEWLQWRGFGAFLSTLVRSLAPRRPPASALEVVEGERRGPQRELTVTLQVRNGDRRRDMPEAPLVNVQSAADGRTTRRLTPVTADRYQTRVVTDTTEPMTFSIAETPALQGASRIVVYDRAAEYRFAAADERLLSELARITGGSFRPTAEELRRAASGVGVTHHPLAVWLLGLALVLWPLDIVLRRLVR